MAESDVAAYYVPNGKGKFVPTTATESPWNRDAQHGGPPTALMAREACALAADPLFRVARVSVDFLGEIPRREVQVEAQIVRPGKRIRLVEATMDVGDRRVALARIWQIGVQPGLLELSGAHAVGHHGLPEERSDQYFAGLYRWGYGESIEWRWETGSYDKPGPASVWTRVRLPLVAGEPLHPRDRALIVADSANGISAVLPLDQWLFVPTSITVTLHRYPDSDWVRLAAETEMAVDGIGSTSGRLADVQGSIGTVTQALLIAPRSNGQAEARR